MQRGHGDIVSHVTSCGPRGFVQAEPYRWRPPPRRTFVVRSLMLAEPDDTRQRHDEHGSA